MIAWFPAGFASTLGIGLRIFLVNDDGTLHPLALTRYHRLLQRHPVECLPQYAGKRVRYALAVVLLDHWKPVEILSIQYAVLYFDRHGQIDFGKQEAEWMLGVELLPPYLAEQLPPHVIDARYYFTKKRYMHEFCWEPNAETEAAIENAVFSRPR